MFEKLLEDQRQICNEASKVWIPLDKRGENNCNAVSVHESETAQIEAMFRTLLEGQQQLTTDITNKIDAVSSDLNGKIEAVYNHVKKLEARISQVAASVQNHAVCRSTPTICVDRQHSGNQAVNRTQPSVQPSTIEKSVDRHTPISVDRNDPRAQLPYVVIPPSVKSDIYAPKVPYPRPKRSKQEIEDEKCEAMLDKIKTEISTSDDEDTSSTMKRLVKRMVLNGLTPEEGALLTRDTSAVFSAKAPKKTKEKKEKVIVSKQSSAVIQKKLPKKLPDPGRFVLDCSISTQRFSHSLCDLGSVTYDDITAGYVDMLSSSDQASRPEDSSELCCRERSDTEISETLRQGIHV
ncbi:unnamed protein product [Arabidopsis arenosa]|uniref:Uncharacterized protein n=1 Tax=Arabidopsis arenosa TaxID=38785 RepID=A0A8S2B0E5_ARAAE|nr:unnamed protein product [Arabidopsis arenosa]